MLSLSSLLTFEVKENSSNGHLIAQSRLENNVMSKLTRVGMFMCPHASRAFQERNGEYTLSHYLLLSVLQLEYLVGTRHL